MNGFCRLGGTLGAATMPIPPQIPPCKWANFPNGLGHFPLSGLKFVNGSNAITFPLSSPLREDAEPVVDPPADLQALFFRSLN
jgi:hypothetical protein